jgi:uncharacterized membrane protein
MSQQDNSIVSTDAARLQSLRTTTLVTYALYAIGIFVGVTAIVGLIVAYLKRGEASGTMFESHLTWLIRTFWLGLIAGIIGAVTNPLLGLGMLILFAAGIWSIWRIVKGFLAFNDNRAIANPQGWF